MPANSPSLVFLFDIDNTLLDNDAVIAELSQYLETHLGPETRRRYFEIFEQIRNELGYADYLGALQRYRVEHPTDPRLLAISQWLLDYPFANRLYPNALAVIDHVRQFGQPAILSDGDVIFQPLKARRSGIFNAVLGHVLIYIHKEKMLTDVEDRYPADHYVLIDDKLRILTAVKKIWKDKVTTIFPKQGHYAHDPAISQYPAADLTIERISDLLQYVFDPNSLVWKRKA